MANNPVSDTAFYCAGARMQDAARKRPLCGDQFAKRFMDERGLRIFERSQNQLMPNVANVARCRIIDDALRARLASNPQLTVISIGSGFDTRPYRLKGGHWVEIDEPQIQHYKNDKLPVAECPNPLQRVEINFATESLRDKLSALKVNGPVVVVIEGVLLYLEEAQIRQTLADVRAVFPRHDLLCDLMTLRFFKRFASKSSHRSIEEIGAMFAQLMEHPTHLFKELSYRETGSMSTYQFAHDHDALKDVVKLPKVLSALLLNVFMRDLHGYAVHEFSLA